MAKLIIESPGLLSTIQDMGRKGYQQYGVSPSGCMDQYSFALGNILVGNNINTPSIEITMMGPTIKFLDDAIIAITGAHCQATLRGGKVVNNRTVEVIKGDILRILSMTNGARSYISIAGGIDSNKIMGSSSTDLKAKIGGNNGEKLKKGDQVNYLGVDRKYTTKYIPDEYILDRGMGNKEEQITEIRVLMGPQDDYFTENGIDTFFSSTYKVTNDSDRMGYRLEGDKVELVGGSDIISDAISFGAVQIPGHGKPIIMMADRQTTGGYAKMAVVISVDLPLLSQLKPGDSIKFKKCGIEEAQSLYIKNRKLLDELEKNIQNQVFGM